MNVIIISSQSTDSSSISREVVKTSSKKKKRIEPHPSVNKVQQRLVPFEPLEVKPIASYSVRSYTGDRTSEGVPDGSGSYSSPFGWSYTGDFHMGKFHGNGTLKYANGDTYEGEFKHHKRDGKGVYTFSWGPAYVGTYVDDKLHGKCILRTPSGKEHPLEFIHGKVVQTKHIEGRLRTIRDLSDAIIARQRTTQLHNNYRT